MTSVLKLKKKKKREKSASHGFCCPLLNPKLVDYKVFFEISVEYIRDYFEYLSCILNM